MILGEKIAQLRKKNGWFQEELAGKLNVSRQSVSKWESAMSVPDLDKIVLMSGLFEVSTDYLLKDELTEEEFVSGNPDGEQMRRISMEEAQRFLKVRREASGRIASGVAACILSPAALLFLSEAAEYGLLDLSKELADGIGMMILLLIVAGAVASFLIFGREMGRYEYLEKEIFELSYGVEGMVRKKSEAYAPVFGTKMAGGVALCILGFIPLILSEGLWGTGMAEFCALSSCCHAWRRPSGCLSARASYTGRISSFSRKGITRWRRKAPENSWTESRRSTGAWSRQDMWATACGAGTGELPGSYGRWPASCTERWPELWGSGKSVNKMIHTSCFPLLLWYNKCNQMINKHRGGKSHEIPYGIIGK